MGFFRIASAKDEKEIAKASVCKRLGILMTAILNVLWDMNFLMDRNVIKMVDISAFIAFL